MKSKLNQKKLLIGGCLLLGLALITCSSIISKTFTIVFYIDDPIASTDQEINWKEVDLTDNKDWKEHHDKIKRIDAVEFAVEIINHETTEATGQIYISKYDSLQQSALLDSALLVLDGIAIPPEDTVVVDRAESIKYIRNYEKMRDYVINGFFYACGVAKNVPFEIEVSDSMAVIVSFTGEN